MTSVDVEKFVRKSEGLMAKFEQDLRPKFTSLEGCDYPEAKKRVEEETRNYITAFLKKYPEDPYAEKVYSQHVAMIFTNTLPSILEILKRSFNDKN